MGKIKQLYILRQQDEIEKVKNWLENHKCRLSKDETCDCLAIREHYGLEDYV